MSFFIVWLFKRTQRYQLHYSLSSEVSVQKSQTECFIRSFLVLPWYTTKHCLESMETRDITQDNRYDKCADNQQKSDL